MSKSISNEQISKEMGWWGTGALEGDCYPEKTAKVRAMIDTKVNEAIIEVFNNLPPYMFDAYPSLHDKLATLKSKE